MSETEPGYSPEEEQKEPSYIEQLNATIDNARTNIAAEYARTSNPYWIACYRTVLNQINLMAFEAEFRGEITQSQFDLIQTKISALSHETAELSQTYNTRNNEPPEDIQENLIEQLETMRIK